MKPKPDQPKPKTNSEKIEEAFSKGECIAIDPDEPRHRYEPAPPKDPRRHRRDNSNRIKSNCKVCRKRIEYWPSNPRKTCNEFCHKVRLEALRLKREARALARREADAQMAKSLLSNQAKMEKEKQKLIAKQIKHTDQLIKSIARNPLTPQDSSRLRGQIFHYMEEQIHLAHNVILGNIEWSPQQTQIFRALMNKVTPDLNANYVSTNKDADDLSELSREDLMDIAAGRRDTTVSGNIPVPRQNHIIDINAEPEPQSQSEESPNDPDAST